MKSLDHNTQYPSRNTQSLDSEIRRAALGVQRTEATEARVYLLLSSRFVSLGITLAVAVVIIFAFNYYLSVAKDLRFRIRFLEMAGISLSVAAISFLIGWALKALLGVDA